MRCNRSWPVEAFTGELDAKRLLHELQVHQIELEMQNEALRTALVRAEAANQSKNSFLRNMSHELRTPLNGILGMAQLLEFTELTEEQNEYISTLGISGHRLLSLIEEILDVSKIQGEKILFVSAKFSLTDCISNVISAHNTSISNKGLTLNVDVAKEIPKVLMGDELLIKQVLNHLLGNALKFTATGVITVSVKILEQDAASLLIQIVISDTGIGIHGKDFGQIFKQFTQVEDSSTRNYGGVGIGLYICRSLAELMGGSLSVESTPDVGSSFRFNLPFKLICSTPQNLCT